LLVVLGPTASGKTRLGVTLAHALGGAVVSADSRQVYRGLDIGSGKDLDEYVVDGVRVPYHLIDVVELDHEFSVFEYQRRFFEIFEELQAAGVLPVMVGGTGLYIESVLSGYRMVEAPDDQALRAELAGYGDEELAERLRTLKPDLHNRTDLTDRDRLIRAIEIATYTAHHDPQPLPPVHPLILGTRWARETLRIRIRARLVERLDAGLIEEVAELLAQGVPEEKLRFLGLEYRYVAEFLAGTIKCRNDLTQKLASAISQFAKRQETWFRRMERNGARIHWIDEGDAETALTVVREAGLTRMDEV
jgi:tRNA dimethylallyltransferase